MRNISNLILVVLFSQIIGCTKDGMHEKHISQAQIWECYQSKVWDESKISDMLVGEWKWIYSESYPEKSGNSMENENMKIEFFSDSTLLVSLNDRIGDTIKWIVVPKDGTLFGIRCDPSIEEIQGRILNCGDILEFNNSHINGVDNYFERLIKMEEQTELPLP